MELFLPPHHGLALEVFPRGPSPTLGLPTLHQHNGPNGRLNVGSTQVNACWRLGSGAVLSRGGIFWQTGRLSSGSGVVVGTGAQPRTGMSQGGSECSYVPGPQAGDGVAVPQCTQEKDEGPLKRS